MALSLTDRMHTRKDIENRSFLFSSNTDSTLVTKGRLDKRILEMAIYNERRLHMLSSHLRHQLRSF